MFSIDDVDKLVQKTGVSYKVAKEALEYGAGNEIEAMIYLEENGYFIQKPYSKGLAKQIKKLILNGMVTNIKVVRQGNVIVEIPIFLMLFFATPMIIGLMVALGTQCELQIVKRDGVVFHISDFTVDKIKEFVEIIKEKVSEKNITTEVDAESSYDIDEDIEL